MTEREKDLFEAFVATVKSTGSSVPVIGQAIAGYDAFKRSAYERHLKKAIQHLTDKVENIPGFLNSEWLKTEDGQQFCWKVFDSALDPQLEDKQELFINALINGVNNDSMAQLEKMKFIDMLRHMSRASLLILAEMHKLFINQVRGPERQPDPIQTLPHINPTKIAQELSDQFHPYLINSAVSEMEGQGLFSSVGDWKKGVNGKYVQAGGFASELSYTDFAAKFVEFITLDHQNDT